MTATAAIPLEWAADIERPAAAQFAALRGETLAIACTLKRRGKVFALPDGATATLYWQTPEMTSAWYSAAAAVDAAAGTVSAEWTPGMDVGAALYRAFLAVEAGGATCYRACLNLRMIDAPGAVPNSLPLPVSVLDFAAVEVRNAPWPTLPADWSPDAPRTLSGTIALLMDLISRLKNNA